MNQLSTSWYQPGSWSLPKWWTEGPPIRGGVATHAQQVTFFSGAFVRNVLKHQGGIDTLPTGSKDK